MRAFNRRLAPKEFGGIPRVAAIAMVLAFMALIFTFMLPWVFKLFTGLILIVCIILTVVVLRLGDDWPLRSVVVSARRESKSVTIETWSRY